jgi:hypothetical protein
MHAAAASVNSLSHTHTSLRPRSCPAPPRHRRRDPNPPLPLKYRAPQMFPVFSLSWELWAWHSMFSFQKTKQEYYYFYSFIYLNMVLRWRPHPSVCGGAGGGPSVSARDLASRPQPFGVVCRSGNGKWWLVTLPAHSRGVSARQLVSLAQEGMAAPPLTPPPRPGLPPTPTFLLLPLFALRRRCCWCTGRGGTHPPTTQARAQTDQPHYVRRVSVAWGRGGLQWRASVADRVAPTVCGSPTVCTYVMPRPAIVLPVCRETGSSTAHARARGTNKRPTPSPSGPLSHRGTVRRL